MQLDSGFIDAALQPFITAPRIYIGYSGGVDSHVLLHLCAQTQALREKLCAVHIHHGIQDQADAWLTHCQTAAAALGVAFLSRRVDARPRPGQSPEETARNARYQAFAEIVNGDEVLLSAQHRDDQMETLLLQLFRGAGLAGLAAMPQLTACGKGWLLRPLLDIPRAAIQTYAEENRLRWIEDPSNAEHHYDRNYLRHAIVPLIKRRWPSIDKTLARTARHCANAQQFIIAVTAQSFAEAFDSSDCTLKLPFLQTLDRYRQQLLLRQWFHALQQKMPPESVIERITGEIVNAPPGHYPELPFRGGAVRRYRDKLYWLPPETRIDTGRNFTWPATQKLLQLPGNGCLRRVPDKSGIAAEHWERGQFMVRYRQGGERIRLPGREGAHELKKIFQEAGIPPWERERTPLIYIGEHLAAVGNLWIAADFWQHGGDGHYRIEWLRTPSPAEM